MTDKETRTERGYAAYKAWTECFRNPEEVTGFMDDLACLLTDLRYAAAAAEGTRRSAQAKFNLAVAVSEINYNVERGR